MVESGQLGDRMESESHPPSTGQKEASTETTTIVESVSKLTVATTGKRQAFRDIRRQLQEAELANPGVQRLLLEDLETAEADCEVLQGFVDRYHETDKRAAVLEERLRTNTALEILFAVGLGVGCALIGFAPSLWDSSAKGPASLVLGAVLIIGSIIARIVRR